MGAIPPLLPRGIRRMDSPPGILQGIITEIKAYRVRVPLKKPLLVFGSVITEREWIFVEAHCNEQVGIGYGLTRGADLERIVQRQIVPHVSGQRIGAIRSIWQAARQSVRMIGEEGLFARALSVVDIALWDVQAKLLGVPLWRLLGGMSSKIPVVAIAGYYQDDPVGAVRRDAENLLKAGYQTFKIPFGANRDLDHQRIAAFREVAGETVSLGLDAGAAFSTVKEALSALHPLSAFNIWFLEDPFSAAQWPLAAVLADKTPLPIAFGESISSLSTLHTLVGPAGVDILRLDATHQLGITGTLGVVSAAHEHAKMVFPHYFPDIHSVLVGGVGGSMIEESPAEADTVGFQVLRASQPHIAEGFWHLSERPGLGIDWDFDAIEHYKGNDAPIR